MCVQIVPSVKLRDTNFYIVSSIQHGGALDTAPSNAAACSVCNSPSMCLPCKVLFTCWIGDTPSGTMMSSTLCNLPYLGTNAPMAVHLMQSKLIGRLQIWACIFENYLSLHGSIHCCRQRFMYANKPHAHQHMHSANLPYAFCHPSRGRYSEQLGQAPACRATMVHNRLLKPARDSALCHHIVSTLHGSLQRRTVLSQLPERRACCSSDTGKCKCCVLARFINHMYPVVTVGPKNSFARSSESRNSSPGKPGSKPWMLSM